MRLTELEHIKQIKDLYMQLRSQGYDRQQATERILMLRYQLEPRQKLTFWIGLADGQFSRKELMLPVAIHGLMALNRLEWDTPGITPGDIERRRKHYSEAPMPERKPGRPKKAHTE